MKAIQTEYFGPGNVRGARYVARDGDGNRVSIQADDTLNSDQLHAKAARTLAQKMGRSGTLVKGWLKRGVTVWVWRQSGVNCAEELAIPEPVKPEPESYHCDTCGVELDRGYRCQTCIRKYGEL